MSKKSIVFLVLPVILLAAAAFYWGIRLQESQYEVFTQEGYIISSTYENASINTTKYYFTEDTKYKTNYNSQVSFNNSDNEEVQVDNTAYVHYINGGIGVLKKTALLDLNTLATGEGTLVKYYNMFPTSILNKESTQYTITNQNNKIAFTNLLIKSSESKYLLASPKIALHIGGVERTIENDFVEITFLDGEIVRIENQEVAYQNISDDMYILTSNGLKIDLANQNIYYNDQNVLNLEYITIDSDDNIEILPEEENQKVEEENPDEEETLPNDPTENLPDGIINPGVGDNEEIIDENEKISDPIFTVNNMEVTANKFSADVSVEDPDGTLGSSIDVKVLNLTNNRVVYQERIMSGESNFSIALENLDPDINYVFIVSADYTKNDSTFTRDFIQKTFITESIGVSLEKNYFSTSNLSFNIIKSDYSRVKSLEVSLFNTSGEVVKTIPVDLLDEVTEVNFDGLTNNTEYTVRVQNFLYDNAIINSNFTIRGTYKTLKKKPTLGATSFTIDKKNALFSLKVNGIDDPDDGISNYRYEIFDARNIDVNNPITVIEKETATEAQLAIDNDKIERNVPYIYRLVATFNDNEKEYEYSTDYSQVMKMDGVEFPSIRFEQTEITFERIEGNIIIVDNNGTVDLTSGGTITVTYTDSVGNTKSFTNQGSLVIPFYADNLRKNETYTISVYASVNLQDGNDTIDNCYIGSITLSTKDTNPFGLTSSIDDSDSTVAFKVYGRLQSATEGTDTTLEANTLSSLTFNLYQGTSTNGALVKSVRKVDLNLNYYESDLKTDYYDQEFELNPSFFGLKNGDLTSEYYTIEVTNAYDYTTYQNDIPILNNTTVVKTNGAVPDLPSDPDNVFEINVIRNKDAGERYRADLEDNTIVGYRIKANYDNSKKYAKKITYNIHLASTGEIVNTTDYTVLEDGNIDYMEFYLEDGTSYDTVDKDFRRGNAYYFSYTATLDLNGDGEAETVYPPLENVVLKSSTVTPEKQEAKFQLYPTKSTANTFEWKYTLKDVDHTLYEQKLYYKIGTSVLGNIDISENEDFTNIGLKNLRAGQLSIYQRRALVKTDENITEKELVNQYFEGIFTPPQKRFTVSLEKNRVLISLADYDLYDDFYQKVSAAKLVFKTASDSITLDHLAINTSGNIVIDLSQLEKFLGEQITVECYLYYDTGKTGFELEADAFSIQQIENIYSNGSYYSTSGSRIYLNNYALNSMFTYKFSVGNNSLVLQNLMDQNEVTFPISVSESGVTYNYDTILLKEIGEKQLTTSGENTFQFDMIVPGVSLMNEDGSTSITPSLTGANVSMVLYGNASSQIKDDILYIEIYKTDETGTSSTFVKTVDVKTDSLQSIELNDLEPNTYYYLKIYADIYNGSSYDKTQLYDVDSQSDTKSYYFKTLSDIGISNAHVSFRADSYNEKYLNFSFSLSQLIGYDELQYEVYKVLSDGTTQKIEVDLPSDTTFNYQMTKEISIPPGGLFETNNTYRFVVKTLKKQKNNITGEEELVLLGEPFTFDYNFVPLIQANVVITSSLAVDNTLRWNVNIYDTRKVIVNGEYKIAILDENGNDITPENYKDVVFDSNGYNQTFLLNNAEVNKQYTFKVIYQTNTLNGLDTFESQEKVYTSYATSSEEISLGTISLIQDNIELNKMKLVFYDSNKLTDITRVRYSIYSSNGYAIDNEIDFIPTYTETTDIRYYSFVLPEGLSTTGMYYIQIQFLNDEGVVAERSLEYNYIR